MDMKNDNEFDDFTGFVAMINEGDPISCSGCFSTVLGFIALVAFILLVIGSCN